MNWISSISLLVALGTASAAHAVEPCETLMLDLSVDASGLVRLNGTAVEPVRPGPGHSRGRHHLGMFQTRYDGQAVLLKRLDQDTLTELRRSIPGIIIGGPRMIGRAQLMTDRDSPREYLVMEEVFAGQSSQTLQGLFESSRAALERGANALMAGDPETRLTRQLADGLVRGLDGDVLMPFDLDFIFTDREIRLIDVGSLTVGRRAKQKNWDRFFVRATLTLMTRWLEDILNAEVAACFRADFLRALRSGVTDDERYASLERYFDEAFDQRGAFIELMRQ